MTEVDPSIAQVPTHVLFADINDDGVPGFKPGEAPEHYLETLLETYREGPQVAIIEGLWELAGLADPMDADRCSISDEATARTLYEDLDCMRLAFCAYGTAYGSRAADMLLQYKQGKVTKKELPTGLLYADLTLVPDLAPEFVTPEYYRFNDSVDALLKLDVPVAADEILKLLDMFGRRQASFTYRPRDLFVSYWTIAEALPDANIPDAIGKLIFDARQPAS